MLLTLKNNYHGTSVKLRVPRFNPIKLSRSQAAKIRLRLCAQWKTCTSCNTDITLGIVGPQDEWYAGHRRKYVPTREYLAIHRDVMYHHSGWQIYIDMAKYDEIVSNLPPNSPK